jgi:hypothetical protein
MPFARGTPKPPGSGRKKGTPNHITREAAERLEELGCDPIAALAAIAKDAMTSVELRVRVNCELLQYVYPKRRAVEADITSSDGSLSLAEAIIANRKRRPI